MTTSTAAGPVSRRGAGQLARVAIVGGGPGGLFLASLLKRRLPGVEVVVFERNQRTDVFGFGVVFSDATLRNIDEADPVLRDGLRDFGRHWDRIEVWSNDQRHGFSGNGMAAIHRKVLLDELQQNAERAGAELRFGTTAPALAVLQAHFDAVVGADGANSTIRQELEAEASLGHHLETASAKFIWFGTTHLFDGLTFVHRVSEHGNFAAHAYPISDELSTFIVETDEATWRRAGLDRFDVTQPPGVSDSDSQKYLETLFADDLAGGVLVANNSRWANFRTRRTDHWWRDNVVLLGDAVHTAHFSVGSGTKMAMEDAVTLAEELAAYASGAKSLGEALDEYQQQREVPVGKIQTAARPSLSWWEHFGTYQQALDPLTFAFHFFSRSIGIDRIAQRDPDLVQDVREAWCRRHGQSALASPVDLITDSGPVRTGRRLVIRSSTADQASLEDRDGRVVTVPAVQVPDAGVDITKAARQLPASGTVAVVGPASLARTLLAEEARLRRGLLTIIAGTDDVDDVTVETALLAGRADAVAGPAVLAKTGEVR
jgi:2-polyprenyl-6-methoxyphenol hydroxylase-like FAD-dependent oxidoreductase